MKTHRTVTPRQEALAERNLCVALAALETPEEVRAFRAISAPPPSFRPWRTAGRWSIR